MAEKNKLLIIEDDEDLAEVIREYFKTRGYAVEVRYDALGVLSRLRRAEGTECPWNVILTDLKMPGMDGIEFIKEMNALSTGIPVVLMTAHGGVETAVRAVKEGAYDFVVKPLKFPELAVSLERAVQHRRLETENKTLREVIQQSKSSSGIIAKSPGMKAVCELVRRVANSSATVLVSGESGVGKEVIAHAIHDTSGRKEKPFVAINCAAIPETLLESELFGFAKGAFTGAIDKKVGLFEEANEGTLFLDEIGDLSGPLQAKLLRVLQERKIKRLGENQTRDVDVRVIAATHKNLAQEVKEGRFREDLFFRLNVIPIRIPPLRDRKEDILPLAQHFLKKFALANQSSVTGFSKAAMDELLRQPWRGNVRELENTIERAVVLSQSPQIEAGDLSSITELSAPAELTPGAETITAKMITERAASELAGVQAISERDFGSIPENTPIEKLPSLNAFELRYINWVVERVGGVREKARRVLEIDRKTLYKKLEQFQGSVGDKNLAKESSTTLPN